MLVTKFISALCLLLVCNAIFAKYDISCKLLEPAILTEVDVIVLGRYLEFDNVLLLANDDGDDAEKFNEDFQKNDGDLSQKIEDDHRIRSREIGAAPGEYIELSPSIELVEVEPSDWDEDREGYE